MSKTTEDLVNELSKLSVLEMSELKTALEEKWGVKAAAAATVVAAAPAAGGGGAPAAAAAEATDFHITLTEAPADKKIGVIKAVREITGLGLKEAKDLVEGAPKELFGVAKPKTEAEEAKKKLEAAGAKVTLKAA